MTPQDIYSLLDQSQIKYEVIHHPAVLTTDEADHYVKGYSFARTKNLFLRTHNRKNYFLYVLLENNRFNEKNFRQLVNTSRLSFASPEELTQILGIEPGMVSPLNLLNDQQHQVQLVISRQVLLDNKLIGVHPNINTQTVILETISMLQLLKSRGVTVQVIDD